ncbi:MAG: hypothetical protein ACYSVY_27570, partial [Planctomycetota bacterium]
MRIEVAPDHNRTVHIHRVSGALARLRRSWYAGGAPLWHALLFSFGCSTPPHDGGSGLAQTEAVTTSLPGVTVQDSERRELKSEYVDETF